MRPEYPTRQLLVRFRQDLVRNATHPCVGVNGRGATRDIGGNELVTRPEPNLDEVVVALHGVPSTAVAVEGWAVGVGGAPSLNTTSVVALAVVVACRAGHRATVGGHGASGVGVERDLVDTLVVDTFDLSMVE